ncbi:hypothetical protein H6P81_003873 [Aristolochia fimbriata]|uniref:Uncharacterized protein n=1 Tax=Aristolochia fimbriata TaxID=158543 RepID=A0AAV7FDU5_ARIFI|nr:hypothetical protein H6P81_003873 [Aristolochia fimbriata]
MNRICKGRRIALLQHYKTVEKGCFPELQTTSGKGGRERGEKERPKNVRPCTLPGPGYVLPCATTPRGERLPLRMVSSNQTHFQLHPTSSLCVAAFAASRRASAAWKFSAVAALERRRL